VGIRWYMVVRGDVTGGDDRGVRVSKAERG